MKIKVKSNINLGQGEQVMLGRNKLDKRSGYEEKNKMYETKSFRSGKIKVKDFTFKEGNSDDNRRWACKLV